jgi:hypothetical protein
MLLPHTSPLLPRSLLRLQKLPFSQPCGGSIPVRRRVHGRTASGRRRALKAYYLFCRSIAEVYRAAELFFCRPSLADGSQSRLHGARDHWDGVPGAQHGSMTSRISSNFEKLFLRRGTLLDAA